ncbi:MAG: serine/threonine-protein phosphatase [Dactylosporangium sp.]|nr:protein phosphatase 2C domain-containing protein [Dactylosporangium sp.]NNJ61241.1 serine/threonine-protein phosphatase [Dactylosporangium sp.]
MADLTWGAATHPGKARATNEDSALASSPIFVVADGMGGRPGGATASEAAVAELRSIADDPVTTTDAVLAAVARANEAIARAAVGDRSGMGTTLVGLALVEDGSGGECWFGFNIGDSRLYRFVAGALEQLSVDHSEIQELIATGAVAEASRHVHPRRNVITRALGVSLTLPEVECWLLSMVAGERFLLCSDGLHNELSDERIAAVLAEDGDPSDLAARLVEEAVSAGGRDNVSGVVIEVAGSHTGDRGVATLPRPRPADGDGGQ